MTTTTTETTDSPKVPVVAVVPPQQITVVPPRTLDAMDYRRNWAMFFLSGGGMVMTVFAAFVLHAVYAAPMYAFYMGLCAMVNIFIIFTGLLGLLVKRTLNVSKTGIIVEDHDSQDKQS